MRLICTHLANAEKTIGADYKAAIELLIDTGRRPDEICRLPFDCLTHDSEGQPVFLYDNFKSLRYRCRLPIAAGTAHVIIAQQQRTPQRFPDTPVADLKLFPTPYGNANGHKAFTLKTLNENHRQWLETLPPIEVPTEVVRDGVAVMVSLPFDLIRIQAKSNRHTYAQRHADTPGEGRICARPTPVGITLVADNYRRHQQDGLAGFNAQVREQGDEPRQEIIEVTTVPHHKKWPADWLSRIKPMS